MTLSVYPIPYELGCKSFPSNFPTLHIILNINPQLKFCHIIATTFQPNDLRKFQLCVKFAMQPNLLPILFVFQWKKMFASRYLLHQNWLKGKCSVRTFEGHTQGTHQSVYFALKFMSDFVTNNMVSPGTHVVRNHQSQSRTIGSQTSTEIPY